MRTRRPIPDDPRIHRAVLAYLSDLTIQESILRAHGVAWATPGLKVASLDHAMWWHRPGRVDDWMLYVQESPSARGGRGLATGRIYSRDGALVASVAQEIMVRVPASSGAASLTQAASAPVRVDDRLAEVRLPGGPLLVGQPNGAPGRGIDHHDDRGGARVELLLGGESAG